ncbi:MAG TPA: calcium:proton antiporter [Casimicrobiaceae bacterium]|nr:calcium:proton antiporter [Casimicrobiaceae bacterium]
MATNRPLTAVAPPHRTSSLRSELSLFAPLLTSLVLLLVGQEWRAILENLLLSGLAFIWLFGMIILGAVSVVRHADYLAVMLGEPYGTMILTLSVASIEILTIAIVMTTGAPNPTLARDTMFSIVMIVLNGLIGFSLVLGGLRYHEQEYNLKGVIAYLSVIVSLAIFGLIMPNYTSTTPGPTFSVPQEVFLIVMCIGLYAVFLAIQTTRHRSFFIQPHEKSAGPDIHGVNHPVAGMHSAGYHAAWLAGYLSLVIFLAEKLAILLNHGLDDLNAPPALGALLVAILVLSPEGLGAVSAAIANNMQRAVNVLMGSALATLALTIPAVVIVGLLHGTTVVLGLNGTETVMLVLTLMVSMLTFASGRTNVLQGAVHVMFFLAYLMLIIWR